MTMVTTTRYLILPAFQLLKRQPDPPQAHRVVVEKRIGNAYGAMIHYRVVTSRKGGEWWISASLDGMRMSNTLHTRVRDKAKLWVDSINTNQIAVETLP